MKILQISKRNYSKKAEAEKFIVDYTKEHPENIPTDPQKYAQFEQMVKDSYTLLFAKSTIMEKYIEKNMPIWLTGYEWNDKEIALFSDIQWIWALDISDKNKEIWYEWFKFIATEVAAIIAGSITMWFWTAAVNSVVYWTRWTMLLWKMYRTGEIANNTLKWVSVLRKAQIWLARGLRWAGHSAVWWASFYAWYWAMQSNREWEDM